METDKLFIRKEKQNNKARYQPLQNAAQEISHHWARLRFTQIKGTFVYKFKTLAQIQQTHACHPDSLSPFLLKTLLLSRWHGISQITKKLYSHAHVTNIQPAVHIQPANRFDPARKMITFRKKKQKKHFNQWMQMIIHEYMITEAWRSETVRLIYLHFITFPNCFLYFDT